MHTLAEHYKLGLTPEEIANDMNLPLALAYYHLNQAEVEADIAANTETAVRASLTNG